MSLTEAVGPVGHVRINENTAAANEIVAADSLGRPIRVLGLVLANNHATNDVTVTVQDDADAPNAILGPVTLGPRATLVLPVHGLGYGQGAAGKSLDLLSDGTEQVAGSVTYQYVGSRGPSA